MTAEEYRDALEVIGETQMGFAHWLGYHPMTGKLWARKGPPAAVVKWVRYLLAKRLDPSRIDYAITGVRQKSPTSHELKQYSRRAA